MADQSGRSTMPERSEEFRCDRAPEGWWCSRIPDHKGPCALRPLPDLRRGVYELADFRPDNGHLHTCRDLECECAVYLYEMVQDLEVEVRRPLTKLPAQPSHTDGSPAEPYGIQTNLLGRAVEKVWGAFHPDRGAF